MLVTDIICAGTGLEVQSQTAKATENTKATRSALGLDWPSTRLGEGIGDISKFRNASGFTVFRLRPVAQNAGKPPGETRFGPGSKSSRLQACNPCLAAELGKSRTG